MALELVPGLAPELVLELAVMQNILVAEPYPVPSVMHFLDFVCTRPPLFSSRNVFRRLPTNGLSLHCILQHYTISDSMVYSSR